MDMDSFGGDITDDILGGDLNENIDADRLPGSDNEQNDMNDENIDGDVNIKVEPKKRAVRNPRIRLTINNLKGNRGIHTIEKYFENIKYHGKGNEKKDLDEILRRMQHWAHRMYPIYKFDDVITNIERLGKKKPLQMHMNRYRYNQLDPDDVPQQANNLVETPDNQDEPFDEFDALLCQQIAISKLAPKTPSKEYNNSSAQFDILKNSDDNSNINLEYHDLVEHLPSTPSVTEPAERLEPVKLSSEQIAKIAENRRMAQEKLKAKRESCNALQ